MGAAPSSAESPEVVDDAAATAGAASWRRRGPMATKAEPRLSKWDVVETASAYRPPAPSVAESVVVSDLTAAFASVAPVLRRARVCALLSMWFAGGAAALTLVSVVMPWYAVTYPEPRGFTGSFNGGVQFYSPQDVYFGLVTMTVCPGIFGTTTCVTSRYSSIFPTLNLNVALMPPVLSSTVNNVGNGLLFALACLVTGAAFSLATAISSGMSSHAMLHFEYVTPAGLRMATARRGCGTAYAATANAGAAVAFSSLGAIVAWAQFGPNVVGSVTPPGLSVTNSGLLPSGWTIPPMYATQVPPVVGLGLAVAMFVLNFCALACAAALKCGLRGSARFASPEGKSVLYDFAGNGPSASCCC